MLAGRNDIAPIVEYAKNVEQFSDDGLLQADAYGYRWRQHFGWDQLWVAHNELISNPGSRRVVIQMWDASGGEWSAPVRLTAEEKNDFRRAMAKGKAVPCNLCVLFAIENEKLEMTVINRSNDMIWGMLGANVVHFSMMHEWMANAIKREMGPYHQITNNLHVYTKNWKPDEYLEYRNMHSPQRQEYARDVEDQTVNGGILPGIKLIHNLLAFETEVKLFVDDPFKDWREPFLNNVAKHMCQAFKHHKARQYDLAIEAIERVIVAEDWYVAGREWIDRRRRNWEAKRETASAK
jgi:hypothetical protein